MEFKKYNSIENSYQDDFISSIIEQGLDSGDFVVQEKVHGANLGFITNGNNIISAKRTELIADDENFYNFQIVKQKLEENIVKTFKHISDKFDDVKFITIFGELCGGQYPHKDVERNKNSKVVQKGIYYSHENLFYAFDIMINNDYYLNVDITNELFERNNIFHARTLFRGNLNECLKYPNEFESKISEWLGLPKMERNICEGVVIKPVEPKFLRTGSRVIIKNKNEKWSENKRFIDKGLIPEDTEELTEEAVSLKEEIFKLITLNRLNNVISKIGEVTQKDYGKLLGLFSKDVLEDFNKNFAQSFEALEKHESKAIKKFLNNEAGKLITNFFESPN